MLVHFFAPPWSWPHGHGVGLLPNIVGAGGPQCSGGSGGKFDFSFREEYSFFLLAKNWRENQE